MRIGISYWGLCASFEQHRFETLDTPDGHRYGRPLMVDALLAAGHTVVALQERRESVSHPGIIYDTGFPELDALFIEYRWPTYKNSGLTPVEPDLMRQTQLLDYYRCPAVVWDTDLKIDNAFELRYPHVILADPCSEPKTLTRRRVRLPFWTDWKPLLPTADPYPVYGYIGNNYERDDEFRKFYFDVRIHGVQTMMFGNWLQRSPERQPPETLIAKYPHVAFGFRHNYYESMRLMNRFLLTTHVSKPEYYRRGFLSPRYFEALAVGCPALVPSEQMGYRGIWSVVDGDAVEDAVDRIRSDRTAAIGEQREELRIRGCYDVSNVVELLESL